METLQIDGTLGEGGGQVLRTALALSAATSRPFHITGIRGGRKKPGLLRQHLTAVQAAARICDAEVHGAQLGSSALTFVPARPRHGVHRFAIGTAGSAPLVLQTAVTALLRTPGESRLTIEGGTENPHAPTSEFLVQVWAPRVRALGVSFHVEVERRGYYPAGGGHLVATLMCTGELTAFDVLERGEAVERRAVARVSALPLDICDRELRTLASRLHLVENDLHRFAEREPRGPGNALMLTWRSRSAVEVFSAIGERDKSAERVATDLATEVAAWEAMDVPVGPHQADQLVLLLALAGAGRFRTTTPTMHLRTQLRLIPRFLPVQCQAVEEESGATRIEVSPAPPG